MVEREFGDVQSRILNQRRQIHCVTQGPKLVCSVRLVHRGIGHLPSLDCQVVALATDDLRLEDIFGQPVRFVIHDKRHAEHLVELVLVGDDHERFGGVGLELVGHEVARVHVEA